MAIGYRDSATFFGTLALRFGIRYPGPRGRSGVSPDRRRCAADLGRARRRVSRHPPARPVAGGAQLPRGAPDAFEPGRRRARARERRRESRSSRGRAPSGSSSGAPKARGGDRGAGSDVALRAAGLLALPHDPLDGKPVEAQPAQLAFSAVPHPGRAAPAGLGGAAPRPARLGFGPRLFGMMAAVWLLRTAPEEKMKRRLAAALLACPLFWAVRPREAGPRAALEADDLASGGGVAPRGAGPAAARLRADRHDRGPRRGGGRRFLKDSSTARGSRPRSSAPRPAAATSSRGCRAAAAKARCCSSTTSTSSTAHPAVWKEAPPFEGEIKHGFLYGRGVYDMKSLGLAQALAMAQPQAPRHRARDRHPLPGRGRRGDRTALGHRAGCSRTGRSGSPGVAQVLNEGGTTEMVLRDVVFWGLETLQAGLRPARVRGDDAEGRSRALAGPLAARLPRRRRAAPPRRDRFRPARQPHGLAADRPAAPSRPGHPATRGARDPARPLRQLSRAADRWSIIYRPPARRTGRAGSSRVSVPPGCPRSPTWRRSERTRSAQGLTILTEFSARRRRRAPTRRRLRSSCGA